MKKRIAILLSLILLLSSFSFAQGSSMEIRLVGKNIIANDINNIEFQIKSKARSDYYTINYVLLNREGKRVNKIEDLDYIEKDEGLNIKARHRILEGYSLEIYISDKDSKISNTIKIENKAEKEKESLKIVGIEEIKDKISSKEIYNFPKYVKAKFNDGIERKVRVNWIFKGQDITKEGKHDFNGRVKGSELLAKLELEVLASDEVVSIDNILMEIDEGASLELPDKVLAKLENGNEKYLDVVWEDRDIDTSKVGEYIIKGHVANYGQVELRLKIRAINLDEEVKFENLELEEILKEDLSKDKLSRKDLLEIKDLSLAYSFIGDSNLKDLKYLQNLEKLDLSFSGIAVDVKDLSSLENLKELNLFNLNLEKIDGLDKLNKLEKLNLAENKIRDISPLENIKTLKKIRLSGNPVKDYSVLLDIYENLEEKDFEIEKVDFSKFKAEKELSLGERYYLPRKVILGDKIVKVDWEKEYVESKKEAIITVKGKTELGQLNYIFNINDDYEDRVIKFQDEVFEKAVRLAIDKQKGDIYISDVRNLKTLEVMGLGAKNISGIEHFKGLEKLSLWANLVGSDQLYKLKGLTNLKSLDLAGNRLSDIPKGIFNEMTELRELVLDTNQISYIDPEAFLGLENLEDLLLEENRITSIESVKGLQNLKVLFIRFNNIKDLDPVKDLNNLEQIWAENNRIEDLSPIKNLKNLDWINFEQNNIENIDALKDLTRLKRVKLSGNKISDLSPLKGKDIEWLMVNDNNIRDLSPLKDMLNMKYLELKNNQIKSVEPIKNLTKIRILYLSGNNIEDFEAIRHYAEDLNARDFDFN